MWHAAVGTCIHLRRSGTTFSFDHRSIGNVWLKRPYHAVADFAPNHALRRYYCNVELPPRFDDSKLCFTDLDMIVHPDGRTQLLDVAEFEANTQAMSYPSDVETLAWNAVTELEDMVRLCRMPFDGCLAGCIRLLHQ